jgi:hypothetical protein
VCEVFLGLAEGELLEFDPLAENALDPTLQAIFAMQAGEERRSCRQLTRNREGSGLGSFNPDRRFPCRIVFRLRDHASIYGFSTQCWGV